MEWSGVREVEWSGVREVEWREGREGKEGERCVNNNSATKLLSLLLGVFPKVKGQNVAIMFQQTGL